MFHNNNKLFFSTFGTEGLQFDNIQNSSGEYYSNMRLKVEENRYRKITMWKAWKGLIIVILVCLQAVHPVQARNDAPTIQQHPPDKVWFRRDDTVQLECVANPSSNAKYKWKKNGDDFPVPDRGRIRFVDPGRSGTIKFFKPSDNDVGVYQCFATNEFGTAVSTRVALKQAFFHPFQNSDPIIKRPVVGQPETLTCSPPDSYPQEVPFWGTTTPGDNKRHQTLRTSDRIQVDYEGSLYFAHILPEDWLSRDLLYTCISRNTLLRAELSGNDHKVIPQSIPGPIPPRAPSLMWSSPTNDKAVKGRDKGLKCIFSGYPTPRVEWRRVGAALNDRMKITAWGHGTELLISNVMESDAGKYICTGTVPNQTPQSVTITLRVESPPFWNQGRSTPNMECKTSVEVEEDGEASFPCVAYGTPAPSISWGINGVSLNDLPSDPRRRLVGNTLTFTDLKKGEDKVIQCVAENEHGTILANYHLRVIC